MPFPFTLPTTSSVLLTDFFTSDTHPSLPLTAATKRSVVKDALKKFKRLSPRDRPGNLPAVRDALLSYLPYLLAINDAAGFRNVESESVELQTTQPLQVEWRSTLSTSIPGREPPRSRLVGLHREVAFVISTLAYVHTLLARSALRVLSDSSMSPSPEERTAAVATGMKHLLDAHSLHKFLVSSPPIAAGGSDAPIDIQPSTVSGLAALALAEANLIVLAKDDPYTAAIADSRSEQNTDWMYKAPSIPKVRAHLYARISLAAAEHASQAGGLFSQSGSALDDELIKYVTDVRRTARGKAARFLAIDADLSGKTGEAIAWLQGARRELGVTSQLDDGKRKGFRGLKQTWQERREDRRAQVGGEWGLDAGRFEETRVVEMLETKWNKENDTMNVQVVPPFEPLLAGMPSGRDYHKSVPDYVPPKLDSVTIRSLRAPLGPDDIAFRGNEIDSDGDENTYADNSANEPAGAFPGTGAEYRASTAQSYY